MRNTHLPLSVAFIDAGEDPQHRAHGAAHRGQPLRGRAGALRAEMNAGWFEERGIAAGAVLRGIDRLPAPR